MSQLGSRYTSPKRSQDDKDAGCPGLDLPHHAGSCALNQASVRRSTSSQCRGWRMECPLPGEMTIRVSTPRARRVL
jgi:hypothetical protein